MDRPKTTGIAVVQAVKALRMLGRERALELLDPALHHYLGERAQPSEWYPEEDWAGLLHVVAALLRERFPDLHEEVYTFIGRMGAQASLSTFDAEVLEVDPAATLDRAVSLWRSYHDTGAMAIEHLGPGHARIELTGYGHPFPEFCRLEIGWHLELLQLSGAADGRSEKLRCVHRGDPSCVWNLTWRAARS